jgi:hypothetical protein
LSDLDNLLDAYISNSNNTRVNNHRNEEKELILKTKCETTEKMIKDYELKYLTAEKEKSRLKKTIDELNFRLDDKKEKNDYMMRELNSVNLVEQNNKVLLKTNENLNREISEMKAGQEVVCKRFEEEMRIVMEKLDKYRIILNRLNDNVMLKHTT